MQPQSITRRQNRPRARTRKKPRWEPTDAHCIQYADADSMEAYMTYGGEIPYRKVMLSCFEQTRGDSYIDAEKALKEESEPEQEIELE